MGWSGRAPAPPAMDAHVLRCTEVSHPMSQTGHERHFWRVWARVWQAVIVIYCQLLLVLRRPVELTPRYPTFACAALSDVAGQ